MLLQESIRKEEQRNRVTHIDLWGTKASVLSEGSQSSPARPFLDRNSMEVMLEFLKLED